MNEEVKQYLSDAEEDMEMAAMNLEDKLNRIRAGHARYFISFSWLLILFFSHAIAHAQQTDNNLSNMNKAERNEYLTSKAKEVVLNFGPKYYKDSHKIQISKIQTFDEDIADYNGEKCQGRKYYIVSFIYDKSIELLYKDFAAKVYIWENNGQPMQVGFGNGRGFHFINVSYNQRIKEGITETQQMNYEQSPWRREETK